MRIVIIGSGNVAQVLAKALLNAQQEIIQMVARNQKVLSDFCTPLQIPFTNDWKKIDQHADLYMIAVSDQALVDVLNHLYLKNAFIVHTAGSIPENVLTQITSRTGIFYPLQSIRKESNTIPPLSILVHATNTADIYILKNLAEKVAEKVMIADDDQRSKYHLAAVIANNFSNHLFTIAHEFCEKNGIEFNALIPILKEQVNRLEYLEPAASQTGPAIRKDENVIEKHLAMLDPSIQKMYEWFTRSIQKYH